MAMVLTHDGGSLRFVDDGASLITSGIKATKERAMNKKTKADLEAEITGLKETMLLLSAENIRLTAENNNLIEKIAKITTPAATVTKVPKEERLAGLNTGVPHQMMECPTHGTVRGNREGYCFNCYCHAMGKPTVAA